MAGVVSNKHVIRYQHIAGSFRKINSNPYKSLYLVGKRAFDIFISLFVICFVLSWLIPLVAILIKLDSNGPVFFTQLRVGFLGRNFRCIKLRTMVVNEDSDSLQARENDPRITRLGYFLRITSLDELPQFLNVLIGDMSIVGPRPFMKSDDQAFQHGSVQLPTQILCQTRYYRHGSGKRISRAGRELSQYFPPVSMGCFLYPQCRSFT